jgi:uncharacterized membrane protein YedE/YeeE
MRAGEGSGGQGELVAAFAAGALFAVGLGIGGMTDPARVLGFLDVLGRWDPTLAFVMAGAVLVHLVSYAVIRRRPSPLLAARFHLPGRRQITAPLVGGAAIFGVGWGLVGYCPGPAVVSLASGARSALAFTAGMLGGFLLHALLPARVALTPPLPSS